MGNRSLERLFSAAALLGAILSGCFSDDEPVLGAREQAISGQFSVGTLIIPMDTTSQDWGMLRAYGLVYRLLANNVPVHWAINPGKAQNAVDFSAPVRDLETGRSLGTRQYRGGPFLVAARDREAALPLINAWLATDCETVVHEATAAFAADDNRVLTSAPRMAVALDRYQTIAFANFNAAGIPDSTGARWSSSSPDLLDERELTGPTTTSTRDGALWNSDGTPKYCHLTFTYYWPTYRTPGVVQEVRSWLASGNLTHLFAQAESLRSFENDSHGRFLTSGGVVDDGYTPWSTSIWQPADPLAQYHGSFRGSPDWMDSIGLAEGSTFRPTTQRLIGESQAVDAGSRLVLLSGPLDGDPRNGRATYLAGFDYGIDLPMSMNPWTNGVRILLNSVLSSECNLEVNQPHVALTYDPAVTEGNLITFRIHYRNAGPAPAGDAVLTARIPDGSTFVDASPGGAVDGTTVRWSLGNLRSDNGGEVSYTVSAAAAGDYTSDTTLSYRVGVTAKRLQERQTASVRDDRTPPDTSFVEVPPSPSDSTDATFSLSSNRAPVTFECSLDGQPFTACAASFTLTGLHGGNHTLVVRATDSAGNIDPTPASHSWRVNLTPVARDDARTLAEDAAEVSIAVLENDELGDAPTAISAVSPASHGQVALRGGTIGYTPAAEFHGADSFTYTIRDPDGQTSTATVTLIVVSVDDVPAASADIAVVAEDGEVSIDVLANDTGLGDAPVSVASVSVGFHGTALVVGDQLHYTPLANYHGPELLTYTIRDGDGETASAAVTIEVTSVNDVPAASADVAITAEDTAVEVDVLANDQVADAPASLSSVSAPAHGSVAITAAGTVLYTPEADYHGADGFSYTLSDGDGELATAAVTVAISAVDDVPQALADTAAVDEDAEVTIAVLANDKGLGDAPVTIVDVATPAHGNAILTGDQVRYVPAPNFNGDDAFRYTIADADGQQSTAEVTIAVAPKNDTPTAADDVIAVDEDSVANTVMVEGNDQLGDAPTALALVAAPAHGTATVTGEFLLYTPDANFHGSDSLRYSLTDADGEVTEAAVAITVNAVNDVPVAVDDAASVDEDSSVTISVRANDSGGDEPVMITALSAPERGTALLIGNDVQYLPEPDWFGLDSFTYTITDADGETSTATVRVTVASVNDTPAAQDDAFTVMEDSGNTTFSVLRNDAGLGDAPVAIAAVTAAAHGSAAALAGEIHYTPAPNFFGVDSFQYTITDGDGERATALVTVTVLPVDDVPVAGDDAFTVAEDSVANAFEVLSNDDLGDAPSLLSAASDPPHGVAAIVGGLVLYSPDADYHGADAFTYTIVDADGQSATATVTIDVASVNDTPVAVADTAAVLGNTTVVVPVLANDTQLGDAPISITAVSTPNSGAAVIEGTSIRYLPNRYFTGAASFTYTIRDGDGEEATATVTIDVTSVNLTPVAVGDTVTLAEDSTALIAVRANDSGGDAPVVTATVSDPPHGTAVIVGNDVRYNPDPNYFGPDSFSYTIRDSDGETATATVVVTVTPVNDTPSAQVDSFTVAEDSGGTLLNVLANDLGLGDAPISFVTFSDPPNGTVVIVGNQLQYTPDPNYNGTDAFTYRIRDLDNQQSTTSVFVTVTQVNDPPTAANDAFTVTAGVATSLNVLNNDRDIDGNPLTLASVSTPSVGTVTISANAAVYTAPAGFAGVATFTYVVTDGRGGSATATVTVTVL
jgi:large repetitive protein